MEESVNRGWLVPVSSSCLLAAGITLQWTSSTISFYCYRDRVKPRHHGSKCAFTFCSTPQTIPVKFIQAFCGISSVTSLQFPEPLDSLDARSFQGLSVPISNEFLHSFLRQFSVGL